jgi:hypothetical protein
MKIPPGPIVEFLRNFCLGSAAKTRGKAAVLSTLIAAIANAALVKEKGATSDRSALFVSID